MALTVTVAAGIGEVPTAPTFVDRINVVGENPYVAGGFPLGLATLLPGKTIIGATSGAQIGSDWGYVYDRTNDKLIVYIISTGAEAGAIDLSTLDVDLLVFSE